MDKQTHSTDKKLTNFEKAKEFNDAFNTERVLNMSDTIFDKKPEMVKLCLSLIQEEVHELEDAIIAKDMDEVRDALSDILYVVYGMQYRLGINGDSDYDIVHSSNMSKLCSSEIEAQKTVSWYKTAFKEGRSLYDSPYYEKIQNTNKWVVKNNSTGKVLKSINYTPVKWQD